MDPEDPRDQQGPDGANPLKVPDVPMQSQPQSQPQPQPQPERHPHQHPQPPLMTRESCTTDLPAPRASPNGIINSSDYTMERPRGPRVLTVVPETIIDHCTTVATDGEAIVLPTPPPGVLTAANPTPTPSLGVSGVSANTCEDLPSTETPGDPTACGGGLRARSMPLPLPLPVPVPAHLKRGTCEVRSGSFCCVALPVE